MTRSRGSIKADFFELNEFPNQALKNVISAVDKISLVLQTGLLIRSYQAFANCSIGLQLDPRNKDPKEMKNLAFPVCLLMRILFVDRCSANTSVFITVW